MACCAFAAFLLVQLLAPVSGPLSALRRRLFGTPVPAAAWRPGAAAPVAPPRRRFPWRSVLAASLVLEISVVGLWLGSTPATAGSVDYHALATAHEAWCGAFGINTP
jgi:hypothetical protein